MCRSLQECKRKEYATQYFVYMFFHGFGFKYSPGSDFYCIKRDPLNFILLKSYLLFTFLVVVKTPQPFINQQFLMYKSNAAIACLVLFNVRKQQGGMQGLWCSYLKQEPAPQPTLSIINKNKRAYCISAIFPLYGSTLLLSHIISII